MSQETATQSPEQGATQAGTPAPQRITVSVDQMAPAQTEATPIIDIGNLPIETNVPQVPGRANSLSADIYRLLERMRAAGASAFIPGIKTSEASSVVYRKRNDGRKFSMRATKERPLGNENLPRVAGVRIWRVK